MLTMRLFHTVYLKGGLNIPLAFVLTGYIPIVTTLDARLKEGSNDIIVVSRPSLALIERETGAIPQAVPEQAKGEDKKDTTGLPPFKWEGRSLKIWPIQP